MRDRSMGVCPAVWGGDMFGRVGRVCGCGVRAACGRGRCAGRARGREKGGGRGGRAREGAGVIIIMMR